MIGTITPAWKSRLSVIDLGDAALDSLALLGGTPVGDSEEPALFRAASSSDMGEFPSWGPRAPGSFCLQLRWYMKVNQDATTRQEIL